MLWIYNIGIVLYGMLVKLASYFNHKAKLFTNGRKHIFGQIASKISPADRPVWFHFASLGEFEQGRPVLEKLKALHPGQKIVITFFSPSGYEIRKNYALADGIFYLPLDTASNARKFIALVNPRAAIFTKYEFWFHYFQRLSRAGIPLYLISGIFRPEQVFFKWYGSFYRKMLQQITHLFVQNQESVALLKRIHIDKVTLSGDTRFDRVYEHALQAETLETIENFCGTDPVLVAGSTWPADERLLTMLAGKYPDWKIIIAPHEIDTAHLTDIEKLFPTAVKYSALNSQRAKAGAQVLIIDNIGLLSSLYQYAKVAYIGGGFGAGIHNTLEAAAYGVPIIFGPKYDKFQEAKDLIEAGAAQSIANEAMLLSAFAHFKASEKAAAAAKAYVAERKGATARIIGQLNF